MIHLVDYMPNVLSRYFDKDMIGSFQNQLKTKQINFHPNEFLIDWKKSGEEVVSVQLLSQTLKADIVIFSAQARPNTSLLKDKVALYEDDTVMVNDTCRQVIRISMRLAISFQSVLTRMNGIFFCP
ncbi:hypothetical protein OIW_04176 [Enterococcus faecium EnGen0040]|nr:hypothetical protein OIW_04176 [Enterococcus faecium EnGen0040]